MVIGKVQISKSHARATQMRPLTAGMVGAAVMLEFGQEWDGLSKTAVFRNGELTKDVLVTQAEAVIPAQLLKAPGGCIWMGIYGVSDAGETVIPTVWASLGIVHKGSQPSGDSAQGESPALWQQVLGTVGDLSALKTQERGSLVGAINEISQREGGDSAYEIAVKNGFKGSEAQWLESLKGDTGASGTTGTAGKNGTGIYVSTNASGAASGRIALTDISVPAGHAVASGDLIICSGYLYAVTDVDGDMVYLQFLDKLASGSGSGMDATAAALLITILRSAVYSTNQSSNITALAEALESAEEETPVEPEEPDEPETVTYTVTRNLTHVSSSNTAASVTEGSSFSATLTADSGYILDAVTVTMGGSNITATAYAGGKITIASVTGNIVITATAVAETTEEGGEVAITKANCVFRWDQSTEYEDGGSTEYTQTKGTGASPLWYSDVFEADTVVNVTVLYGTANTNLRQYCACISADAEIPASDNFVSPVYYMQQIGSASTSAYTAQYTVRGGYRLAIINYNTGSPNSITVTK